MPDTVARVKIRIGMGLGTRTDTNGDGTFGPFVDDLERLSSDNNSDRISEFIFVPTGFNNRKRLTLRHGRGSLS